MSEVYSGKGITLLKRIEELEKQNRKFKELMTTKDISNLLEITEKPDICNHKYVVCTGNIVIINITINASVSGILRFKMTDKRYHPKLAVKGSFGSSSSSSSYGTFMGAEIDINGGGFVWMKSALGYTEFVTIVYPIDISEDL